MPSVPSHFSSWRSSLTIANGRIPPIQVQVGQVKGDCTGCLPVVRARVEFQRFTQQVFRLMVVTSQQLDHCQVDLKAHRQPVVGNSQRAPDQLLRFRHSPFQQGEPRFLCVDPADEVGPVLGCDTARLFIVLERLVIAPKCTQHIAYDPVRVEPLPMKATALRETHPRLRPAHRPVEIAAMTA
jgi:hypothetical protein